MRPPVFVILFALATFAQDAIQKPAPAASSGGTVPRLVSFGGVLKDDAGKPVSGPVSITFSLFAEQDGGTPLWSETQVVDVGPQGRYAIFLGATNPNGLPLDIFANGAARWLAVQPDPPAAVEPSRILLVGVPYALKAADADTLGGKPASAFMAAPAQSAPSSGESPAAAVAAVPGITPATTPTGSGTTDYVPLWTSSTNLGNSILFQSGSVMEVNGTLELPALGTATASTGYDSQPFDLFASAYNSSSKAAVAQHFRWQAEPVSNDTSSASGRIDLLYASGTSTPAETGLSINPHGVITFASGQTFPGTGPGTITGVTAGTDLTGGGTSGKVTLNLDTTKVPQLNASNNFTGNQGVSGNITATGTITAYDFQVNNVLTGGAGNFEGGVQGSGPFWGVYGYSNGSIDSAGVWGYQATSSSTGTGIYGELIGASTEGSSVGGSAGVWGDTNQTSSSAVVGTADAGFGGAFYNNTNNGDSALSAENDYSTPSQALVFSAGGNSSVSGWGSCSIDGAGDLTCSGTKSAVVAVDNNTRKVALYAVEAPENWFEDFGSGHLSSGAATIALEPTFAQTVNTGTEYHVFLTPKGDCKGLRLKRDGAELRGSRAERRNIKRIVRLPNRREAQRLRDRPPGGQDEANR
ncbi:MAG: hypothetical protein JOY62_11270 [Acidobacteriaceae bacterium]|nr:hypothetical protein [Acidobacteriaceae bacterium]MBV9780539.1 hypothetical protein [Acidobacteriaceae bacterium]